jgi:hypothetical protein
MSPTLAFFRDPHPATRVSATKVSPRRLPATLIGTSLAEIAETPAMARPPGTARVGRKGRKGRKPLSGPPIAVRKNSRSPGPTHAQFCVVLGRVPDGGVAGRSKAASERALR